MTYTALVRTGGSIGRAIVTYRDAGTGALRSVYEDLRLRSLGGSRVYVGSNPRDRQSGLPVTDYLADLFVLSASDDGSFDRVCQPDGTGCASATTVGN